MSPLVRQIYTNISLVAMIPAVIWAASAYNAHDLSKVIGGFPFYYLAVCQLLIAPRYIAAGIIIEKLGKSKYFSVKRGIIGLLIAGFIIDVGLTTVFAKAIGDPEHSRPFIIPLVVAPLGFMAMLIVGVSSGYTARWNKPSMPPAHRKKR